MSRRILITGATGYVGNRLAERLIAQGEKMNLLCRTRETAGFIESDDVSLVGGNLLDKDSLLRAMKGCDRVYHLAALARVWAKQASLFYDVNVKGTENVIAAALQAGVSRVVFCSSGSTLGPSNGIPVDEDTIRSKGFFNEYETSKFIAEERALRYCRKGIDVVVVHPCRVYGPGVLSASNAVTRIVKGYLDGSWRIIPGDGESIGCYSYIEDVVDGHLSAMELGQSGERYILGGPNLSFNQLANAIMNTAGRDQLVFRIPFGLIKVFGLAEEWRANLFGAEPLVTRTWLRRYQENNSCSSDKAVRELRYRITPIEEGLKTTIDWIQTRILR